jgi:hypothetical protein
VCGDDDDDDVIMSIIPPSSSCIINKCILHSKFEEASIPTIMHPLGFMRMSSFLFPWIFGVLSIPLAIGFFVGGVRLPAYFLIFYYSFRQFFPAKHWPLYREMIELKKTPYFNNMKVEFDKGAFAPKKDSKTMLAMCPHGILTIGWATLVSLR